MQSKKLATQKSLCSFKWQVEGEEVDYPKSEPISTIDRVHQMDWYPILAKNIYSIS